MQITNIISKRVVLWFSGVPLYTGNTFMVQLRCFHWLLHLLYVCGYFFYSIIYCSTTFLLDPFSSHTGFVSHPRLIFFLIRFYLCLTSHSFGSCFALIHIGELSRWGLLFLEILWGGLKDTVVERFVNVANIWNEQFSITYVGLPSHAIPTLVFLQVIVSDTHVWCISKYK